MTGKTELHAIEGAMKVKLLLLDVDGVLTDGRIIFSDGGLETKCFDVKDGHAIKLSQRAGIQVGIITGRTSDVVARRAEELGIELLYQGRFDKVSALDEIVELTGIGNEGIAYVGDDIVDVPIMSRVGFSAAVGDAVPEAKENALYVASRPGGRGAVREIIEFILKNQGLWSDVTVKYRS
jgi:3-deoxy-D-manno-octulosonate 8-phosphate phosphatase (KDO 8-P phosphatase)